MSTHDPSDGSDKPFPSPEELQRKLGDFLKSNFGDRVSFSTFTQPETSGEPPPAPDKADAPPDVFHFHCQPRDIKARPFGQMDPNEARKLREREREKGKPKKILAEALLKSRVLATVAQKRWDRCLAVKRPMS